MINYIGGKFRHSKAIAELLESHRKPGQPYLEPFVGGAWVVGKMTGERYASDENKALITYFKAAQQGYIPPYNVSEEEYKAIKENQDVDNPLTAFAMLNCSFGGKWGGGYARNLERKNFAASGQRKCLKHREGIKGVVFSAADYRSLTPKGMLIYCDPPYQGSFNHAEFWEIMRKWSKDNTVLISEYAAPDDFVCIKEFNHRLSIRSKEGCAPRIEKIFKYKE